jgi:hypothetical protein
MARTGDGRGPFLAAHQSPVYGAAMQKRKKQISHSEAYKVRVPNAKISYRDQSEIMR